MKIGGKKSDFNNETLALAMELRTEGVSWKRLESWIGSGIKNSVHTAKRDGMRKLYLNSEPGKTMNPKKPMLAVDAPKEINFPVLASPKIDGIRCTIWNGRPYTRSLKEIPNAHIRETIAAACIPWNLDGELIVGDVNAPDVYRKTNSAVMSHEGKPDFVLWVFDEVRDGTTMQRIAGLRDYQIPNFIGMIPQKMIHNAEELNNFESEQLALGFEGVIIRSPGSPYKHGRSTAKEGYMMKVKRFTDSEAVIVGMEELYQNQNESFINELGHTARSSMKDGLVPMDTLGAFICRTPSGIEFKIGTGFTAVQRKMYWKCKDRLMGKLVKYKHFEIGVKDKPRHPVFIGFRDERDL